MRLQITNESTRTLDVFRCGEPAPIVGAPEGTHAASSSNAPSIHGGPPHYTTASHNYPVRDCNDGGIGRLFPV